MSVKMIKIMPSAAAGLREIMTGDPGVSVIELTDHEIVDLALSGVAFTVDGRYKLVDRDGLLRQLEDIWRKSGKVSGTVI